MTTSEFTLAIGQSVSKNSTAYKLAMELATQSDKVSTCHATGSGRWTSNADSTDTLSKALTKAGISHVVGNDAPRGGKAGQFIALTDLSQVAEIRAEFLAKQVAAIPVVESKTISAEIINTLAGLEGQDLIKEFFKNEIHPCPPAVLAFKNASGLGWAILREIYG